MLIEKGLIYAIIPARSGSLSVKDKNIRLLHGHPMIAYSIAAAKLVKEINRVIVTTDSEKYREIAQSYGAEAPFLRPTDISGPSSIDLDFMIHAIQWFESNEQLLPEYWIHLRPTTPFRDPQIIKEAISLIVNDDKATSLRSAHNTDLCPMKWFKKDDNGYFEALCGMSPDEANGPRQSFPNMYIPNGYVDILKTEHILKTNKLHGNRVKAFIVPSTVDVDYEHDFEYLVKKIDECAIPLINWLNNENSQ